ncbi:MAG: efflux RND transporter periplasmic adaptor subunit, partial [Acidobacteriia bacterium]|nr:efflux RND transporter periplasmic adaptor subunit [Terriglobia bacterium]
LVALTAVVAAGIGVWANRAALRGETEAVGTAVAAVRTTPVTITALGRIEPGDGVRYVAGPSNPSVVIGRLFVEEGDPVTEGQLVAVLDNSAVLESRVARLKAWLANAELEYQRNTKLFRQKTVSAAELDAARMNVEMGKADVQSAQAELALAQVRAPITGTVLKVHARTGERVGPDGIAEIGETGRMYAVAEVYETDVPRVHVGQRATVTSPAFAQPLHGTVDRVGRKVAKQDVLNTDPAARTDARVVEVRVHLDEDSQVAGLTNLETEVAIEP